MKLWKFIQNKLEQDKRIMLLVVINSKGSSPGRSGFKMAVCDDKELEGSIGGGIMEYDIVELARAMLDLERPGPVMKKQIHKTNTGDEHSGMICSGEQTIILIALESKHQPTIKQINESFDLQQTGILRLSPRGFEFSLSETVENPIEAYIESESLWEYKELVRYSDRICIIGAGHVGLALSKLMKDLGFIVEIFDDRPNLNTLESNQYADKKHVVDYQDIDVLIPQGKDVYVAIMTFGHKADQDVFAKLLGKNIKYLGIMGSKAKIAKIFKNVGYNPSDKSIPKVYAPIGISIKSQTPMEIAVSIAAEIIGLRNSGS